MRFYGIEETDEDENSLKVLQSFLEWQCGIEPGIEFQHVHRIGKPAEMVAQERLLLVSLDMVIEN